MYDTPSETLSLTDKTPPLPYDKNECTLLDGKSYLCLLTVCEPAAGYHNIATGHGKVEDATVRPEKTWRRRPLGAIRWQTDHIRVLGGMLDCNSTMGH